MFLTSIVSVSSLRCALAFAALGATTWASVAQAAKPAEECIAAHADGQVLRANGKLLASKERFLSCVSEQCPTVIRTECAEFAEKIEASLPTVVLAAVDDKGTDLRLAKVRIDDQGDALALDGSALALDPGTHRFQFVLPDGRTRETTVLLREAEKLRRIEVTFNAAPVDAALKNVAEESDTALANQKRDVAPRAANGPHKPESRPESGGVHPLVFAFGTVGVIGVGSAAYFWLDARGREKDLEPCGARRDCAQDDVDTMQRHYLFGDLSAAAAGVSFALGAYFLFFHSSSDQASRASHLQIGVRPLSLRTPGAVLNASGSF